MHDENRIFAKPVYLSSPDTHEIKKTYGLKLQISHGIPSKLQLAVKGLENGFYILTCIPRDLVIWRPTTKVMVHLQLIYL